MCRMRMPSAASYKVEQPKVAAVDNTEAVAQGDMEARLRRRRGGAAKDILTSPVGIPVTPTLGGVAA